MDFDKHGEVSMEAFALSRQSRVATLANGKAPPETDLGNVIAFRLEARVYVSDTDIIEIFDDRGVARGARARARRALRRSCDMLCSTSSGPSGCTTMRTAS